MTKQGAILKAIRLYYATSEPYAVIGKRGRYKVIKERELDTTYAGTEPVYACER